MLKNKELQVIGLTGLQGHGKTEIGDLLADLTGFHKVAFGDAVKRACAGLYNINLAVFYEGDHGVDRNTTVIAPYGLTIRQMMRNMGDAMKSNNGGSFWIDLLKCDIERMSEKGPLRGIIVEDIRYDEDNPWGPDCNEAGAVRDWGGTILHIDAMSRVGRKEIHETHSSEKGVKRLDGDVVINNNDSLENVRDQIESLIKTNGWYKL